MASKIFNPANSLEASWKRFRRNVYVSAVATFVGYSFSSAHFLAKRFDAEFMSDDFKRRLATPAVTGSAALAADSASSSSSSAAAPGIQPAAAADGDDVPEHQAGSSMFDAWRGRKFRADKVDTSLFDNFQRPAITVSSAMYLESQRSPLSHWDDAARSANVGDILLLSSADRTSWRAGNALYAMRLYDPWALRFSHAALVVDVDRTRDPPELYILEAAANADADVAGRDGVVRRNQVQIVSARERVFSEDAELQRADHARIAARRLRDEQRAAAVAEGGIGGALTALVDRSRNHFFPPASDESFEVARRCFRRAAFRRLEGFEWTPERRAALAAFAEKQVGRPLDASLGTLLAQIHTSLYRRADHADAGVAPAELIVDALRAVGAVVGDDTPARAYFDADAHVQASVRWTPSHLTPKLERERPLIWASRFTHLGPEEKVLMFW
jgi:hypothetical protein